MHTRRLLTNGTYCPIHDAVLGLWPKPPPAAGGPPTDVKQVKTDCLLLQGLPKSRQESLEALTRLRHQDGTPVFRVEECKPLLGRSAPPRMEAERPALRRWRKVEDPLALRGRQLPVAHRPAGHREDVPCAQDRGAAP